MTDSFQPDDSYDVTGSHAQTQITPPPSLSPRGLSRSVTIGTLVRIFNCMDEKDDVDRILAWKKDLNFEVMRESHPHEGLQDTRDLTGSHAKCTLIAPPGWHSGRQGRIEELLGAGSCQGPHRCLSL